MDTSYAYHYTKSFRIKFLIDAADLQWVAQHTWNISRGYVRRTSDGEYLHKLIADPAKGLVTDHINRDKLDNRRSNLRVCTRRQNLLNASVRSDNKTGYRCVIQTSGRDTFEFNIWCHGKRLRRCGFATAKLAYEAYLKKAKELF